MGKRNRNRRSENKLDADELHQAMTKRTRSSSEKKEDSKSKELISQLPDDILVIILSRLPVKDAVATSTLSIRWRYLWTCISGMSFEAEAALDKVAAEPKLLRVERPRYINQVNWVLRRHRGATIDLFQISFDLDKDSKKAIDRWIKFAIGKRVQRLELNLQCGKGILEPIRHPFRNYTFPHKLLTQRKGCSSIHVCSDIPTMQPCASFGFMFLKDIRLNCVNLSEETLKDILLSCPALQSLYICGTCRLVNIKIYGQSLRLRTLEIVYCWGLKNIEICNTKLVSFNYEGRRVNVVLQDVPMLKAISLRQGYSGPQNFEKITQNCLHQIQVLTLDIYNHEEIVMFKFPELHNMKQLNLNIGAWNDECLLDITCMVKACPFLEKLVLKLIWMSPRKKRRKIRQAANFHYKCIKFVEIYGYYGRATDLELAMHFIQNAARLEKMVIDPLKQMFIDPIKRLVKQPPEKQVRLREEAARTHAKRHIAPEMPPGVTLDIP